MDLYKAFRNACLLVLLFVLCFVCLGIREASSHDVDVTAQWAYNGDPVTTNGFKLYAKYPGTEDWVEIANIPDGALREWVGVIDIQEGRNILVLTAYNETDESAHSTDFPIEYIRTIPACLLAPTVRFTITMDIPEE